MQATVREEAVRLAVPASLEYVRVIRLVAAGMASSLDFDVHEVDDLRVAVGELANIALEVVTADALEVVFTVTNGRLLIEGHARAVADRPIRLDVITRQILDAVVDGYSIEIIDEHVRFSCSRTCP
jgi:serine/threonine-protein kinase RsbW